MRSSEIPASTRFYLLIRSFNSKHTASSPPARVAAPKLKTQPRHASKHTTATDRKLCGILN